jgi:NTP pyrophosphatase (non-canonical NTP hydrolase)
MSEKLNDQDAGITLMVYLPPELVKIGVGPDMQRFFDAMIYKLRRNHHKGNWNTLAAEAAWADLQGEVGELGAAIRHGSSAEILMEAADVANEALIVANIALQARAPGV